MAAKNDKRIILIIICMASFITPFLGSSVNIALPSINTDFAVADQSLLGWVVLGFLLVTAILVVPFGRIADVFGRKAIFVAGLSVIILSSLLCSISGSILMLIAARLVEGLGSAMIFGTSIAILTSVFPAKERGRVLGFNVAIVYIGLSAGPFLGGIVTQYIGWRYIYAGIAAYTLLVALLAFRKINEEWRCAETGKFDVAGMALYAATLFSLVYGLSQVPDIVGWGLVVLGVLLMAAFFRRELRVENPIVKVSVFRKNVVFTFSNLAALINYSATFAVSYLLSLYLQYLKVADPLTAWLIHLASPANIQAIDPQTAGLILLVSPIVQAIFSPMAGRLSDKVEPRIVASAGMGLCVIGLALFAFLTPSTPLLVIIAGLAFMGLGFALFSSPNTNAIMGSVDRCDYGVASGMVSTMRLIGQMMSLSIALLIFSVIMGHTEISPQMGDKLMGSIQIAFVAFAALCTVGLVFSLARGNLRKAGTAPIPQPAGKA